jgi:hypothetical protein
VDPHANHTWLGLVFVDKAGVKHVGVWDSNHVQKLHDYGMTTEERFVFVPASHPDFPQPFAILPLDNNQPSRRRGAQAGGQCLELCRRYILNIAKTVRDNEGCFCLDPESKWVEVITRYT